VIAKNLSAFVLIAGLILPSCGSTSTVTSDQVADSDFYQEYTVDFDAAHSSASVVAELFESSRNGSSIELVAPSRIFVNDLELIQVSNRKPIQYLKVMNASELENSFRFFLEVRPDLSFESELLIQDTYPSNVPTNIDRNEDTEIEWTGDPILNGETVSIKITDENSYSITASSTIEGLNSILVPAVSLSPLQNGVIQIQVIRSRSVSLGSVSAGGKINVIYRSLISSANLSGELSVSLN